MRTGASARMRQPAAACAAAAAVAVPWLPLPVAAVASVVLVAAGAGALARARRRHRSRPLRLAAALVAVALPLSALAHLLESADPAAPVTTAALAGAGLLLTTASVLLLIGTTGRGGRRGWVDAGMLTVVLVVLARSTWWVSGEPGIVPAFGMGVLAAVHLLLTVLALRCWARMLPAVPAARVALATVALPFVAILLTVALGVSAHEPAPVLLLGALLLAAALADPPPVPPADPGHAQLLGRRWWIGLLLTLCCLAAPLLLVALGVASAHADAPALLAAMLCLVVLTGLRLTWLMLDLQRIMTSWQQALRREQVLRTAAALLVSGPDRHAVPETVVGAALAALEDDQAAVWFLWPGVDGDYVVAAGNHAPAAGATIPSLGALRTGRGDATLTALVVVVRGRPYGHLVALTDSRLEDGVEGALETLVAQAGLALDAEELSEDLHRRRGEERLRRLVQDSSDIVAVLDRDALVRYVTPAVERVLGRPSAQVVARPWTDLVWPEDRQAAQAMLLSAGADRRSRMELRLVDAAGGFRYVETVTVRYQEDDEAGFVLTCHDVTERHELEEQLRHQAFHDPLTGLANRALFQDRLDHALSRRQHAGTSVAVLLCDLDDFKTVNDSLGHAAGDELLVAVTERIRSSVRDGDTAARLGGDEFAILLEELSGGEAASDTAQRLVGALRQPFVIDSAELLVGMSIGIASARAASQRPLELMRDADLALYVAKSKGKNCFVHFAPAMHTAALQRLQFTGELRHAIDQAELVVHYQPIVDLDDRSVVAFEALVRWQHPMRGLLPPSEFIPLAEESGLVVPLGLEVLRAALRQAVAWNALGLTPVPVPVTVNLSGRQIADPRIVDDVREALETVGADPALCVLEITESVLLDDVETTVERLQALRDLGLQLLIDDFGTGYSSLSRLQQLPVDGLKAAREFVTPLPGSAEATGLAKSIQSLAESVGLRTVAEGIELQEQADALRALGYRYGQGYLYAQAMPGHEVAGYLLATSVGTADVGTADVGTANTADA